MNKVNIVQLYGVEMNIYGDNGNVLVLQKRLERRNIKVDIKVIGIGDKIPTSTHIIVGGGGQDAGQSTIANDLKKKKYDLSAMSEDGIPMLMICGMYQMFGNYFKTSTGDIIEGIGLLDVRTEAGTKRIIGNVITNTKYGELIGYENHSGRTYIGGNTKALGTTKLKQGNNGKDKTEGAVYNNVFATYLHGPVLAKAPIFADKLLFKAMQVAGINEKLSQIDDDLSSLAAASAKKRPR